MRLSSASWLLAATTLLTDAVSARPNILDPSLISRRSGRVVTTGVPGTVQPRLEVRQLEQTQPDQWTLFLLGMQRWMEQDPTDGTGTGYYGIAGIHGVPTVSWGGVEGDPTALSQGAYGYCTHKSIVFPSWHRAYLALFEQTLVELAVEVAQEYPESSRARMVDAAQKLRLPFWDWAAKPPSSGQVFPNSFTQPTVVVNGPNGEEIIGNPLYQFNISNPSANDPYTGEAFVVWDETLRYPTSETNPADSQNSVAQSYLNSAQPGNQESVYNLLSNCPSWSSFSNTGGAASQCSMSIEGIHNNIHSLVGGIPNGNGGTGGHMAYLPVAAFDPAFWVHHANVDRILALWQGVYGNEYGDGSQPIGYPTWTNEVHAVQDANSPLTPFFRNSNGDFHTTNSVKNWKDLNYDYPEFMATDGSQQAIENVIAAYYGPSASLTAGSIQVPKSNSNSSAQITSSQSNAITSTAMGYNATTFRSLATALPSYTKGSSGVSYPTLSLPTVSTSTGLLPTGTSSVVSLPTSINNPNNAGTTQNQYVANIVADNNALNSTWRVYVFYGQPECSEDSYGLDNNLIGSVTMWSHHHATELNGKDYGAVPLTFTLQKLVDAGKIANMSPDVILPWLRQNLEWRIVSASGEVSPDQVKGFSLSIYSAQSEIQSNGGLPKWSPVQPQIGVTKGKNGGADNVPNYPVSISSALLAPTSSVAPATYTTTMVVTQTHTICPCATAASY
ncbi:Hypothetical protein R9X50_00469000 [Acrodontium crateriforme]|uniref:tyrosinase n=1 Tax=Acrodontium crateriforme TaxID=150365 RepID=A0AAQ3R599_9PEZI|nr:Hypothetical protein R9X50_00469000 [Acrodontium crateriforme]